MSSVAFLLLLELVSAMLIYHCYQESGHSFFFFFFCMEELEKCVCMCPKVHNRKHDIEVVTGPDNVLIFHHTQCQVLVEIIGFSLHIVNAFQWPFTNGIISLQTGK